MLDKVIVVTGGFVELDFLGLVDELVHNVAAAVGQEEGVLKLLFDLVVGELLGMAEGAAGGAGWLLVGFLVLVLYHSVKEL